MSRLFLTISLLISFPLCSMQVPEGAAVKFVLASRVYKQYIEKNINKLPYIGMVPAAVETVESVSEPSTINTVYYVGQVAAAAGTIGLLAAGPQLLVGAALGSVASWLCYSACTSSSTATNTTSYSSNDFVTDPVTQFNVYPNDERYAALKEKEQASVSFAFPAPTPPMNNGGGHKKSPHEHVHPELKEHKEKDKKEEKKSVKSEAAKASQRSYDEYHNANNNRTTQWEVSYSFPIEQPTQFYGQAAADLHYSPSTTIVWSKTWTLGE